MLKSLSDSRLGSATPREAVTKKVRPSEGRIRVVVRKRPLSARELDEGRRDVLQITTAGGVPVVMVHEPKTKVDMTAYVETHAFRFDGTYGEASSNRAVYDGTAAPLINRLFAGETATCFAYGATGAGKTHTMLGSETEHGIYILAAISIFDRLAAPPPPDADGAPPPLLRVSSYEIYGGKVFDLLNGRRVLPVREDAKKKVNVVGLTETICESIEHFRDMMIAAHDARQTAATMANGVSSRSHAVLQLSLCRPATGRPAGRMVGRAAALAAAAGDEPKAYDEVGRLSFIDLAGTERGAATLMCDDRERRAEGAEINKSLLALKECIRGLDAGRAHVPFRGSKLTEVLRDSFMGESHTVMIGAIGPSHDSVEQTLNTLRYASTVHDLSAPPPALDLRASLADLRPPTPCAPLSARPGPPAPRPLTSRRGGEISSPTKKARHLSAVPPPAASPADRRLSRVSSVPALSSRPSMSGRSPTFRRPHRAAAPPAAPPPAVVSIDLGDPPPPVSDLGSAPVSGRRSSPPPVSDAASPGARRPASPPAAGRCPPAGIAPPPPAGISGRAPLPSPRVSLSAPPPCLSSGSACTDKENLPGGAGCSTGAGKPMLSPVPDSPFHDRFGTPGAAPYPSSYSAAGVASPMASPLVLAIPAPRRAAAAPPSPATLRALLDAHRCYIADAVSALDMHTTLMSEAEEDPEPANYVGATHALIKAEMGMLAKLQAAMEAFQPC